MSTRHIFFCSGKQDGHSSQNKMRAVAGTIGIPNSFACSSPKLARQLFTAVVSISITECHAGSMLSYKNVSFFSFFFFIFFYFYVTNPVNNREQILSLTFHFLAFCGICGHHSLLFGLSELVFLVCALCAITMIVISDDNYKTGPDSLPLCKFSPFSENPSCFIPVHDSYVTRDSITLFRISHIYMSCKCICMNRGRYPLFLGFLFAPPLHVLSGKSQIAGSIDASTTTVRNWHLPLASACSKIFLFGVTSTHLLNPIPAHESEGQAWEGPLHQLLYLATYL